MIISVINLIINVFMSTTNPNSYLDTAALELLKNDEWQEERVILHFHGSDVALTLIRA